MAGASRVTVIGRSLRQIAAVWGGLQSFYSSADLVVSDEPLSRGLEEPCHDDMAVFVILDDAGDFESLQQIDEAPEWLIVLSTTELTQRMQPGVDSRSLLVPVLPVEDAHLALLGRNLFSMPPYDRATPRERL